MPRRQIAYTEQEIEAMRDWIADCYSHDFFFDIDDLNDQEVVDVVKREYDGGIAQFVAEAVSAIAD